MPSDRWQWDATAHRYRDGSTGRFLGRATAERLQDELVERFRERMGAAMQQVIDGAAMLQTWETSMRAELKALHGTMYLYGRGGLHAMQPSDWERASTIVRDQWDYLRGFTLALSAEDLSEAQALARARSYADAGHGTHAEAMARTYDGLRLPAMPGDGNTQCKQNCRCRWRIIEDEGGWRCTWELGSSAAGPCDDCKARAARWAPFVQEKDADV